VISPKSVAIAVVLTVTLFLPSAGRAQDGNVTGAMAASVVGTRLAGQSGLLLGGQASLRVSSRFSVGGFGYGTAQSIRIVEGALPEDLRLGYGGLVLDVALKSTEMMDLSSSLLVGAGNAQIHAQPIGNQLGSDNFLVFEPRLNLATSRIRRVRGTLGTGYRFVAGVQDLPRLTASDLRGWTITLSVSFGGF
jgi:hypothetical protein